jgi:hypothetical protein
VSAMLHAVATGTFSPFLRTLARLLAAGARHVETEGGAFAALADARLAGVVTGSARPPD